MVHHITPLMSAVPYACSMPSAAGGSAREEVAVKYSTLPRMYAELEHEGSVYAHLAPLQVGCSCALMLCHDLCDHSCCESSE